MKETALSEVEAEMVAQGTQQVDVEMVKSYAQDLRSLLEGATVSWFYVNKCETVTSQPGLAANILIRKLSMLR